MITDIVRQQKRLANLPIGSFAAAPSAGAPSNMNAPWVFPPEGFQGFDPVSAIPTPAIGSGDTVVLSFRVPFGWDGVIKGLIHQYSGGGYPEGSGGLIWRLLIDGRPVRNYENMLVEFGSSQQPRPIGGVRIYQSQLVTYVVNAAGGGGWLPSQQTTIICGVSGWIYPRSLA